MGGAARNPSQRAQAMGFAQLNPSYVSSGAQTGCGSAMLKILIERLMPLNV